MSGSNREYTTTRSKAESDCEKAYDLAAQENRVKYFVSCCWYINLRRRLSFNAVLTRLQIR